MKKIFIIILTIYIVPTWSMENQNKKNSNSSKKSHNTNTRPNPQREDYISLNIQNDNSEEDDNFDDVNTRKDEKKIITVYQQNGGMVLPGKWVVINGPKESLAIRMSKAAWKQYCTPKSFKNCSCGILAIFIMVSMYKLGQMIEQLTDESASIS